ncbi:MAG: rhodanese-like domain-containing protein [Terrimonas sp.]|nr:rhodanese-like domain-containing protein [Terrimonas sp.]
MLATLKKWMGFGPSIDFAALTSRGAQIIDVRTESEYKSGHIRGSLNIPLNTLQSKLSKLKKDRPVITCCASGMRSASAKSILKAKGFTEVYNGGSWMGLQNKLAK